MIRTAAIFGAGRHLRCIVLFRYVLILAGMSLVWEFAQMPLYTLGQTESTGEIVYGAFRCTVGDAMIGAFALIAALLAFGDETWPRSRWVRVLCATVVLGLGYTLFSEWLNVEICRSWTYSVSMPVLPLVGTGLAPLLQWLVIPSAAYFFAIAATGSVLQRTDQRKMTKPKAPAGVRLCAAVQVTGAES